MGEHEVADERRRDASASVATERWASGSSINRETATVTARTSTDAGSKRRAAPGPEAGQRDRAGAGQLGQQQAGDEEAGDDEEHVDPDEAALEAGHPGVEQHHDDDGQRAQALDVGAEGVRPDAGQRADDRASPRHVVGAPRRTRFGEEMPRQY